MAILVEEGLHPNGMDLVVAGYGTYGDSERWLRCYECKRSFREPDYRYHMQQAHIERPYPDAMTALEVAKALGISDRRVRMLIQAGKIHAVTVPRGVNRLWIRRNALKTYCQEAVAARPDRAVKWAEVGIL